jgi:hypothetical protein
MEVKNNFMSVVSLGCFNPAILTPDFLKDYCGFTAHSAPTGRTTPIATGLDYGSISFFVDLERFQIKHSDINDFQDSGVVAIMMKYLAVLEHTPLHAIGVNLNYEISGMHVANVLQGLQKRRKAVSEFLGLSESTTVYKFHSKGSELDQLVELDTSGPVDLDVVERLNVLIKDDSMQVNYNHEIRNLTKNRKLFEKMDTDWLSLIDKDKELRKMFFQEKT